MFSKPLAGFGQLLIIDEGNIKTDSIELNFNLTKNYSNKRTSSFKYSVTGEFNNGHVILDFYKALENEGVASSFLLKSFFRV